jgi:hypothetical protein
MPLCPNAKKVIQVWANVPEHVERAACDAFDKRVYPSYPDL